MAKWSEIFPAKWDSVSVPEELDRLQQARRKWHSLQIVLVAAGASLIGSGLPACGDGMSPAAVVGAFLLLFGIAHLSASNLAVHIKLSALRIVWELQKSDRKAN